MILGIVGTAVHSKELATAMTCIMITIADGKSMQSCPSNERE
jgi:hypothetical protein